MPSLKNLREELSRNNSIVAGIEQSFKRQQAWTGRHPTPPLLDKAGTDVRTAHGTARKGARRGDRQARCCGWEGMVWSKYRKRGTTAGLSLPSVKNHAEGNTVLLLLGLAQQLGFVLVQPAARPASQQDCAQSLQPITSAASFESQSVVVSPALRSLKKGSCSRSCAGGDGRRMQMQMQMQGI